MQNNFYSPASDYTSSMQQTQTIKNQVASLHSKSELLRPDNAYFQSTFNPTLYQPAFYQEILNQSCDALIDIEPVRSEEMLSFSSSSTETCGENTSNGPKNLKRIRNVPVRRKETKKHLEPKKGKKGSTSLDRVAKLEKPLSELTKHQTQIPLIDIDAFRPMNSFMLYRKAYQNRAKGWCSQNNHQVVSQVCGTSWLFEPSAVKDKFNEWARIERINHQIAHPEYKFSPNKSVTAKPSKQGLSFESSGSISGDIGYDDRAFQCYTEQYHNNPKFTENNQISFASPSSESVYQHLPREQGADFNCQNDFGFSCHMDNLKDSMPIMNGFHNPDAVHNLNAHDRDQEINYEVHAASFDSMKSYSLFEFPRDQALAFNTMSPADRSDASECLMFTNPRFDNGLCLDDCSIQAVYDAGQQNQLRSFY
ncbi:BgTH12-05571 [Blumeria graminis f. sp. triticale]|uniref:BgTH12-05571 n=1 Tax=Blumeria graminis f. sp. triticale TaxID=1689686 RepID=A0A9W4GGD0_BLUGR|nr:BgTH12-05571 [Blumeria graminis f. sp. triticale]